MEPTNTTPDMQDDFLKMLIKDDLRPYMDKSADVQNGFLIFLYIPDDRSPDSIVNYLVDFDASLLTYEMRETGNANVTHTERKLSDEELSELKNLVEVYDKVPGKTLADSLEFMRYYRYIDGKESVTMFPDTPAEEFIAINRYVDKLL